MEKIRGGISEDTSRRAHFQKFRKINRLLILVGGAVLAQGLYADFHGDQIESELARLEVDLLNNAQRLQGALEKSRAAQATIVINRPEIEGSLDDPSSYGITPEDATMAADRVGN